MSLLAVPTTGLWRHDPFVSRREGELLFQGSELKSHFHELADPLFQNYGFKLESNQFLYVHLHGSFDPSHFIQDNGYSVFPNFMLEIDDKSFRLWRYKVFQSGYVFHYFALVPKVPNSSAWIPERLKEEFEVPAHVWFSYMSGPTQLSWHTDPHNFIFHHVILDNGKDPSFEYEDRSLACGPEQEYVIFARRKHRAVNSFGQRLHLVAPISWR